MKTYYFIILMAVAALFAACDTGDKDGGTPSIVVEFGDNVVANSVFGGGDGSEDNPYLIYTAGHLKKLVDDVNSGNAEEGAYYRLEADFNVTASEWTPIGSHALSEKSFRGNFDGNGHAISGALRGSYKIFGFFGATFGASIKNLTVSADVDNAISRANYSCTGGIVGYVAITDISYCRASGTVSGGDADDWSYTGGIAGYFETIVWIHNCLNDATVIAGNHTHSHAYTITGGIVGCSAGYSICLSHNLNQGMVTAPVENGWGTYVGGIVGAIYHDFCDCNINMGIVNGNNHSGGGFGANKEVGYIHRYTVVKCQGDHDNFLQDRTTNLIDRFLMEAALKD